jgi:uncharacterized iron-regulated membrane protein
MFVPAFCALASFGFKKSTFRTLEMPFTHANRRTYPTDHATIFSMSTIAATAFVAFILMMSLIIWVIWELAKDRNKISAELASARSAPSLPPQESPRTKYSRLFTFGLGLLALMVGSASYWLWENPSFAYPFQASPGRSSTTAVGIIVMGIWLIFRSIRGS